MTDFPPDEDEFNDEDVGWDEENPDVEATQNNPVTIGRVPLNIEGTVWADITLTVPLASLRALDIDLQPLFAKLGIDPRSPEEKFLAERHILEVTDYLPGTKDRGPYYGRDELLHKLSGMRAAWHLIEGVTVVTGEELIDVYYLTIGDSP